MTNAGTFEERLQTELGCSAVFARLLVSRGFDSVEGARVFLSPELERDWLEPNLLRGMETVVDRLERALDSREHICVFGDFDLDGLSATALMLRGLQALGAAQVSYLIPHRLGDGYGLSDAMVEQLKALAPDLVITVDNGISAEVEVAVLMESGIDVVITDHHEPGEHQPLGVPIIDPKLDPEYGADHNRLFDSSAPTSELSGAGVALKVIQALGERRGMPELWHEYLDLATLGTIADVMPLLGENRALVAEGIKQIRSRPNIGLAALAEGIPNLDLSVLTAERVVFALAPRLNAAGRVGDPARALELLLAEDPDTARRHAEALLECNTQRQELERELETAACDQAAESYHGERALILAGENWHDGVRGIVASRLAERYGVVTVIGSVRDGAVVCSARSVGSVDLFKAFTSCADLFDQFGGHPAAAGLTLQLARFDEFKARLLAYLDALPPEAFDRPKDADIDVDLVELNFELAEEFDLLEPCGHANPQPTLRANPIEVVSATAVGARGEHLRFVAGQRDTRLPAIWFRARDLEQWLGTEKPAELLFRLEKDSFRGRRQLQLHVKDLTLLDEATLREELRRTFIGDAQLHPAQVQSLEALAAGTNTLTVMATGRGKSLIFHLHAALTALCKGQPSLFVYPLRALVADQAFYLETALAELGLSVAILTGETTERQRRALYEKLSVGEISVVLTTPEFLHFNADILATAVRFGFVVIDEAHHIARARVDNRPIYAHLGKAIDRLGNPRVLATTATAGPDIAARIRESLQIECQILDPTTRENLRLVDHRADSAAKRNYKQDYLLDLVEEGGKLVVYVNSRAESVRLTRIIRKAYPSLAPKTVYYHAGLDRPTRVEIQQRFRDGDLRVIVATSAFGEGVNVPDIRDVVLYHFPYSDVDFNQMSGRAGRDGHPAAIHLLFNEEDAAINHHILSPLAPPHASLAALYRVLQRLAVGEGNSFSISDKDLAQLTNNYLQTTPPADEKEEECVQSPLPPLNEAAVATGLAVFEELGFISVSDQADERLITVHPATEKVELTSSIRYREGLDEQESFESFKDWALAAAPEDLANRITHPLLP